MAAANAHDAAEEAWAEKADIWLDLDDRVEPALRDLRRMGPMLFGPKSPVLDALGVKRPPRSAGPSSAAKGKAMDRWADPHEPKSTKGTQEPPPEPASQRQGQP
jgi:hypothetical protein